MFSCAFSLKLLICFFCHFIYRTCTHFLLEFFKLYFYLLGNHNVFCKNNNVVDYTITCNSDNIPMIWQNLTNSRYVHDTAMWKRYSYMMISIVFFLYSCIVHCYNPMLELFFFCTVVFVHCYNPMLEWKWLDLRPKWGGFYRNLMIVFNSESIRAVNASR